MKRRNVTLHVPYSTGFGVGVQHWVDGVNSFFDLRLEGKVHRFEAGRRGRSPDPVQRDGDRLPARLLGDLRALARVPALDRHVDARER